MASLKALVIGVSEYDQARKGQCIEDTNMPCAAEDARRVVHVLNEVAPRLGFSAASGRLLIGAQETRRAVILAALQELAAETAPGDQLVLYFSGHSLWTKNVIRGAPDSKEKWWYEMVLCPSDTDWSNIHVSASDVGGRVGGALEAGACLEIILETCSATGLSDDQLRRSGFGDGYNNEGPGQHLGDSFVRWDAAELDQSSHSGVYPACDETQPLQGLFTRLFCDSLLDRAGSAQRRQVLLDLVEAGLQTYRTRHIGCCGKDPFDNIQGKQPGQTPHLRCHPKAKSLPTLMANCHGASAGKKLKLKSAFKWRTGAP